MMISAPKAALTGNALDAYNDHAADGPFTNDLTKYRDMFLGQPALADAMDYSSLHSIVRHAIWDAFDLTETLGFAPTGPLPADYPADPFATEEPWDTVIDVPFSEGSDIYARKVANVFKLDIDNLVPWKLRDYSETELRYLLDGNELFYTWDTTANCSFNRCVDHNPKVNYDLVAPLIAGQTSQVGAIDQLMTQELYKYRHSVPGDSEHAVTMEDSRVDYVGRYGCHHNGRMMAALLRSVNIPAQDIDDRWAGGGHQNTGMPTANRVLPHGDHMMYDNPGAAWGDTRLDTYDYWVANVFGAPQGITLEYDTVRLNWLRSANWISDANYLKWWNPFSGWKDIRNYGPLYLTQAEMDTWYDNMKFTKGSDANNQAGTIHVSVTPETATWTITGPDSNMPIAGTGNRPVYAGAASFDQLYDIDAGDYTITYDAHAGYSLPTTDGETLTLGPYSITFTGAYVPD